MLQKIASFIPLTTIFIVYLFLCGGLYLIGFWGTFDIDISSFVGLTEIPKSFIMPFAISNIVTVANICANVVIAKHFREEVKQQDHRKDKLTLKNLLKYTFWTSDGLLGISVAILTIIYSSNTHHGWYWLAGGFEFSIIFGLAIQNNQAVKKAIPYRLIRIYFCCFMIYTPVMSFVLGKTKAIDIYNNDVEIRYTTAISSTNMTITSAIKDTSSLKLLGFLGSKIIVSSLDNKRILILNESTFKVVEIVKRDTTSKAKK